MHLQRLVQIFTQAGLNVRLGSFDPDLKRAAPGGTARRQRTGGRAAGAQAHAAGLKDFDPCTILLNNDLRGGVPRAVQNLHEQYLLPPLHAGWAARRKSNLLPQLRRGGQEVRQAAGHGPVADQPDGGVLR
jgi:glutamate--cysteine ligase